MKKVLFLMLSLAVSAGAYAGVMNSKPVLKAEPAPVAKSVTHKAKLDAPAPIMKMIQQQQQQQRQAVANLDERYQKEAVLKTGNIIEDQPAGTVKYYQRTAGQAVHRYYNTSTGSWSGITYTSQQTGSVMAVENGNNVWFKNLIYDPDGYFDDYWIQGVRSGNRITIPLQQEMLNYSDGSSIILVMGTLTYSSGFSWTRSSSNTATFNVSGNTLTLANTSYNGNYGGTCLGCDWDDGYGWAGFADFGTTLVVDESIPDAPVMYTDDDVLAMAEVGGTMNAYARTGDAIIVEGNSLYLDTQDGVTYVYFAEDGSVYMRNPVYGFSNATWVKGTLNGNTITVPLNQYIYWDDYFYGLKTTWGYFVNGEGYTAMPEVTECTYTIGEKSITLDNATDTTGLSLTLDTAYVDKGWYGCLDWNTVYWNAPDMPENLTVEPDATTAEATWDGGEAEEWNLRYRQYNPNAEYYFCDFEDASDWGIFDMDGDGHYWGYRELEDGTYCVTSASWDRNEGALTPDNWLVSPVVNLNGVVRFRAWGQDPDWAAETFAVYVTTNPDYETTDDFQLISDPIITANALDEEGNTNTYIFDLSAYAGQQGCIAIRHYDITDMFMLNVDDFYVGDPDAPVYEWVTVTGITEIPYTIEGLTPETTYEVQVAGVNGGAVTIWTESTIFTTLPEQTGLRGDVDDNGSVNISDVTCLINHLLAKDWDSVAGQFSYDNADCDLNGTVNISDVTALINYLLSKSW